MCVGDTPRPVLGYGDNPTPDLRATNPEDMLVTSIEETDVR